MKMIKHVIFDIGNVLVTFEPYPYLLELLKNEEAAFTLCQIFRHEAWLKYDQGLLMLDDLRVIYHHEYPGMLEEVDLVLENWMKLMKPMKETYEFQCALKQQGYQIYILSNISKDSADYLKATQPFFEPCNGMVLSYEELQVKPDLKLFQTLLNRYQLEPDECLFFDDNAENVQAANQLGIHGIQFHTLQQAKKEAQKLLKRGVVC